MGIANDWGWIPVSTDPGCDVFTGWFDLEVTTAGPVTRGYRPREGEVFEFWRFQADNRGPGIVGVDIGCRGSDPMVRQVVGPHGSVSCPATPFESLSLEVSHDRMIVFSADGGPALVRFIFCVRVMTPVRG